MLFSQQLSLPSLIELCRTLRHYLSAGLTLRDVFRQQARKGPPAVRPVAERISEGLEKGGDLEDALKREPGVFPPLFVSLTTIGEETGMLPEVCRELERYYTLQQRLRQQFLSQIAWPILQLVAAIFVIAGLILILGILSPDFDPVGIGTGPVSALAFLGGSFGSLGLIFLLYVLGKRVLREGIVDALLLRVPVVGPCIQALAITRFCLGLRLTLETGMSIKKAIRLSMTATGNSAFTATTEDIQDTVGAGGELSDALGATGLFPEEFPQIIAVGEESGRLTEVLEQQAGHYQEASERRLSRLAQVAAWLVWLFVAALLIFLIFRIFTKAYLEPLNEALKGF